MELTGRPALVAAGVAAAAVAAGGAALAVGVPSAPSHPLEQVAALPADGHSVATLEIRSGTPLLDIKVANLGGTSGTLLRASVPGDAPPPVITVASGGGRERSGKDELVFLSGSDGASAVTVTLNAAVTWRLDFAGGTERTAADLRGGRVAGITVAAGSDIVDLALPRPRGTVPVLLSGGASQSCSACRAASRSGSSPPGAPARCRWTARPTPGSAAGRYSPRLAGRRARPQRPGSTSTRRPGRRGYRSPGGAAEPGPATARYGAIVSSYRHPGTVLTDHMFLVPLDHAKPDGEQIEVFGREVVATGKADQADDLPWLVFLQGGPGFAAQRPVGRETWLARALDSYRVLLLDQRGTGRSSRVTARSLARLGSARAQADYLALFRADSIVLDAELIRRELTGGQPWSVLGQSFGGFCTVTYLSFAPAGMREALITGGLPGLDSRADDVYRITYRIVAARNAAHYQRYPGDVAAARQVAEYLAAHEVRLPDGARLTVEAFQAIGGMLGSSTGTHELHYLLEDPFDGDGGLSDVFLQEIYERVSFARAPLYAVLHEACYAQGAATRWAAQRVRSEFGSFDASAALSGDAPVLFTGEMIYPWMVDNDPALRQLREAAELIAERDDWPPLYDPARLAANEVPAAAAVYYDDMYVPAELSTPTAAAITGLKAWVTNEYEHNGLRVSDGRVLDRLIAMNRGDV